MIRTANLTDSVSRKAGGLHESVRRLVQSVAAAGVEVRVMAARDEFTEEDLSLWRPVPVDVFPRSWPHYFGYSPGFLQVLNAYRPDLTHTHGIWLYPSVATAIYGTRQKVPYMISPHGMVDPWAVRNQRWKKVLAYALYETNHLNGARCIRALCESEARSIRKMKIRNPIAVIPNGIDLPELGDSHRTGLPPWNELVPDGKKVLLFLSRIHPKKGLENLIRAWANAPGAASWVLAIAGWDQGAHEMELKRVCDLLGLAWADIREPAAHDFPSIIFLGPQHGEAKERCYRRCDAFVLPSFSEGLPMVVLEAWAYGKPVLMTAECNLPEGFDAGSAIKIDTAVEGVRRGLEMLMGSSPHKLTEMGLKGRRLVESRFTWESIAAEVKTTYEWMLGGGPKPACFFPG